MTAAGKAALFESMKGHLAGSREESYAATAARLGMSEGRSKWPSTAPPPLPRTLAGRNRPHVAAPEEIEEEIRYLFTCFRPEINSASPFWPNARTSRSPSTLGVGSLAGRRSSAQPGGPLRSGRSAAPTRPISAAVPWLRPGLATG